MKLRIKEVLKEKKITAVSLAATLGIAQPSMSNIVNGKVMPSIETLDKIATALGVEITELFSTSGSSGLTCPNCGASLELKVKEGE